MKSTKKETTGWRVRCPAKECEFASDNPAAVLIHIQDEHEVV